MANLLEINLPSFSEGDAPLELPVCIPHSFHNSSSKTNNNNNNNNIFFEERFLIPIGLSFRSRVEIISNLNDEENRWIYFNENPEESKAFFSSLEAAYNESESSSDEENNNDNNNNNNNNKAQSKYPHRNGTGSSFSGQQRKKNNNSNNRKYAQLTEEELEEDWYAVLNIESLGDAATEEQIKNAYRRRCLETHPDKKSTTTTTTTNNNNNNEEGDDELFKKVQKAYDILSNEELRLVYDSSRPFDDTIPPAVVEENLFFSTFAPVFERNKKWGLNNNFLPELGDLTTPYEDVLLFYDRWRLFHSTRDLSRLNNNNNNFNEDEEEEIVEIHDGMCREERRFYQRENERILQKRRREEKRRIEMLIQRAKDNDPRLKKKKEEEEKKRKFEEAEKRRKEEEKRMEVVRKRLKEEEEKKKKKEEERMAVIGVKMAIKACQSRLVDFFTENDWLEDLETNKLLPHRVRRPNISWIFSKISTEEEAKELVETIMNANSVPNDTRAAHHVDPTQDVLEQPAPVAAVLAFNEQIEKKEKQIGQTRYGEPYKRIDNAPRASKSLDPLNEPVAAKEWTEEDLSRLHKATAKYPPGTIERWSKIAAMLKSKFTEEQAMAKVNEVTAALQHGSSAGNIASSKKAVVAVDKEKDNANAPATPVVEEWTVKQQKQLEQGLRDLKEYKEKDKFQKIAKMVEGKTAKECFERFKYLCSVNKK